MTLAFDIAFFVPAAPEQIYCAWLSAEGHTQMTGSPATVAATVGGAFTAWSGYISGTHKALYPGTRLIQSWRTAQFPPDAPDSQIDVRLDPEGDGTRVTIRHTGLPPDGAQYASGWVTHYQVPMCAHFAAQTMV